jgi:superfamily II DNA or RNA helicase
MNINIRIPKYEIHRLDVKDEYDRTAICHILEEHKQVMIKANTPGCGKSYICEGMVELGHNVIFICPTNKLVQKYEAANDKITSTTINKFFSLKMGEQKEKKKSFNYSEFNVFVFDEIYCNDIQVLNRIKKFIDNNKDKIIIATGDSEQLKPVKDITNQDIDYDDYMDSVMSQLFKNEIFLRINKRFKKY